MVIAASAAPSRHLAPVASICAHCGDAIPSARRSEGKVGYCCDGCAAVAALLQELALDRDYYALRAGKKSPRKPVDPRFSDAKEFSALDEPPFREPDAKEPSLDFFLEGIHCAACIWILEKLPELSPEIASARLDFGRSILRVRLAPVGKFSTAANLLLRLGYAPHPVITARDAENRLQTSDRQTLRRMGVSAFAAMNVMIYSISLYTGVDGSVGTLFRWLSIGTSIPALTYGAWPFYRNAWNSLRGRRISIDLPIAIAFIGGFAESLRQTLLGSNLLYLDSLTSLVFLMLASRYALSRLERAEVSKSGLLQSLVPARAVRVRYENQETKREIIRADRIQPDDRIELSAGSVVPVDGKIENGEVWLDLSILSGESRPLRVQAGEAVFAGAKVCEGTAEIRAQRCGAETRVGSIARQLESAEPRANRRTERSDRWAAIFLAVVIGFAALLLVLYGRDDPAEAARRSLSLLIIACPCALALATPLTLARAFRLAASRGILLRNPELLDRMLEVNEVVFDKTGTLTLGRPEVLAWTWRTVERREEILSIAYSLEANARHPYGIAIRRHLESLPGVRRLDLEKIRERTGFGIEGSIGKTLYRICRGDERNLSGSGALRFESEKEGVVTALAEIELADELRPEARAVVDQLHRAQIGMRMLSGDAPEVVSVVARQAGISHAESALSPEDKRERLARLAKRGHRTLMIGDGVNDALALKEAHVGVAMNRGDGMAIESALASADVALLEPDLERLLDLFSIARQYRRTLHRNAVLSALYNLVGASFAAAGLVHPLVAAVAMPVSALTVFLSTSFGLRAVRRSL
jgi:Cu2+-exporting ATPase/Cu+-exporting ATPase